LVLGSDCFPDFLQLNKVLEQQPESVDPLRLQV